MSAPDRRAAMAVAVIGGVGFAALAVWLVPWAPVPGGTPPPVPVGSVLSAEEVARAEDFSRWARAWSWGSLAVSLAVACWLGFTSAGERLVRRLPGPWWAQVLLAVAALSLIGRLATAPFSVAMQRLRLDVGLTTQAWTGWLRDLLVSEAVGIVTTGLVLLVVIGSARRWRRAWPAVAGGLAGVLVLLGSYVYPVLVEPLFNEFTPLTEGSLRSEVLAVAEAEGVQVDEVLVADASRRTTTLNAYVSGFGGTRRVVLYDTLVADAPEDQVLSVVAHELAHARHDDVLVGSVLGAFGAVAGVGVLALLLGVRRRSDAAALQDPAVVPRVLAMVAVAALVTSPVQSGISRLVETRADVEALAATREPEAFVAMQRRLAVRSLADPTPPAWSQAWFGSHPTLLERVALARRG